MTNKAIKFFETEIRSLELAPELNGCEMTEEWQEQMDIFKAAKEALEKQIPKKPIEDGYYDEPCVCPTCGGDVTNMADNDYHFQHCHYCGQKLDWSDTE